MCLSTDVFGHQCDWMPACLPASAYTGMRVPYTDNSKTRATGSSRNFSVGGPALPDTPFSQQSRLREYTGKARRHVGPTAAARHNATRSASAPSTFVHRKVFVFVFKGK